MSENNKKEIIESPKERYSRIIKTLFLLNIGKSEVLNLLNCGYKMRELEKLVCSTDCQVNVNPESLGEDIVSDSIILIIKDGSLRVESIENKNYKLVLHQSQKEMAFLLDYLAHNDVSMDMDGSTASIVNSAVSAGLYIERMIKYSGKDKKDVINIVLGVNKNGIVLKPKFHVNSKDMLMKYITVIGLSTASPFLRKYNSFNVSRYLLDQRFNISDSLAKLKKYVSISIKNLEDFKSTSLSVPMVIACQGETLAGKSVGIKTALMLNEYYLKEYYNFRSSNSDESSDIFKSKFIKLVYSCCYLFRDENLNLPPGSDKVLNDLEFEVSVESNVNGEAILVRTPYPLREGGKPYMIGGITETYFVRTFNWCDVVSYRYRRAFEIIDIIFNSKKISGKLLLIVKKLLRANTTKANFDSIFSRFDTHNDHEKRLILLMICLCYSSNNIIVDSDTKKTYGGDSKEKVAAEEGGVTKMYREDVVNIGHAAIHPLNTDLLGRNDFFDVRDLKKIMKSFNEFFVDLPTTIIATYNASPSDVKTEGDKAILMSIIDAVISFKSDSVSIDSRFLSSNSSNKLSDSSIVL